MNTMDKLVEYIELNNPTCKNIKQIHSNTDLVFVSLLFQRMIMNRRKQDYKKNFINYIKQQIDFKIYDYAISVCYKPNKFYDIEKNTRFLILEKTSKFIKYVDMMISTNMKFTYYLYLNTFTDITNKWTDVVNETWKISTIFTNNIGELCPQKLNTCIFSLYYYLTKLSSQFTDSDIVFKPNIFYWMYDNTIYSCIDSLEGFPINYVNNNICILYPLHEYMIQVSLSDFEEIQETTHETTTDYNETLFDDYILIEI